MALTRLSRQVAQAVALCACVAAPAAHAVVVYSGPLNVQIPNDTIGLYFNLVTGTGYTGPNTFPGTTGPGSNYDFNLYQFGNAWTAFSPGTSGQSAPTVPLTSRGYVAATSTGGVLALALGTTIDGSSTFNTGSPDASTLATGAPVYFGLRFRNEGDTTTAADDTVHYGWVQVSLPVGAGSPGTLLGYAFESTPLTAVQAGVVPEPATWALMGLGALGVAGWARRQRR
jgi:hypothetical protein